jgi:hypothetical protein
VIAPFAHALDGFGVAAAAKKIALAHALLIEIAARPRDDRRDDVKQMMVTGRQQPFFLAHFVFPLVPELENLNHVHKLFVDGSAFGETLFHHEAHEGHEGLGLMIFLNFFTS